jgi:nucleoside-diphosphate-sugar epimerase
MQEKGDGAQGPAAATSLQRSIDTGVLMADSGVNPALPASVLVLGGGYSGRRFADTLRRQGCDVSLTTRREPQEAERPGNDGCRWLRFDPEAGVVPTAADLAGIEAVLVTIPPDAQGRDPVLQHLGTTLQALAPRWVGYLSTTGVYGDSGGDWVDEDSPTRPGLPRSRARLACEQAWRQLDLPLQIFRLPAIYGPGRSPLEQLRNGTARLIHKPGQVFSRVHVDDIAGALLHCLALPAERRPETLILADTCPCPSSEMLGFAAHLLDCKLPPLQPYARIEADLSPMARSFWSENRRASSRRLRQEVGYRLRFPTYREGLSALTARRT